MEEGDSSSLGRSSENLIGVEGGKERGRGGGNEGTREKTKGGFSKVGITVNLKEVCDGRIGSRWHWKKAGGKAGGKHCEYED